MRLSSFRVLCFDCITTLIVRSLCYVDVFQIHSLISMPSLLEVCATMAQSTLMKMASRAAVGAVVHVAVVLMETEVTWELDRSVT